jgi:tetratricopeptide (TPR) repeat protein
MRRAACILGLALLAFTTAARADGPGDARLAQALFDEGRNLMEQKKFAEACPKLKESQRLDPGGGTLLNLASCHAGEGKTALALDEFREALSTATKDGRKDREQIARSNIEKLEREVPRVTVIVPHPVSGIEVRLDNTPLVQAAWGVGMPVDPGSHTVMATATGYQGVKVLIDVRPGERKVVEVPAPRRVEDAEPAPTAATLVEVTPVKKKPNPLFWTALITGFAGTAVGSVAGILFLDKADKAKANCSEARQFCIDGGEALADAQTLSNVVMVAVGVSLVGFTVALILPSKKAVPSARLGSVGFRF